MSPDGRALVSECIQQQGPLTVAGFMELALYAPSAGYYARTTQASGRSGDFYTSVDVGPLFGELLAHQFSEMARLLAPTSPHASFTVDLVEAAAGNGRLSKDVLDAASVCDPWFYQRLALHLVERSPDARSVQRDVLGPHAAKLATSGDQLPAGFEGIIFANELLDALPTHLVMMTKGGLREIYVDLDGDRLVARIGPLSTPSLGTYLEQVGARLEIGSRAEINLAAQSWIRHVADALVRGFLVIIDYGYEAPELYASHRAAGTLSTFQQHQLDGVDPDSPATPPWLVDPGSRDITAHVDFTGIRQAAEQAGLEFIGLAGQTHVLMSIASSSGTLERLNHPDRLKDRLALKTLVVPGGLGSTHSMMVFGKGVGHPELIGLRGIRDRGNSPGAVRPRQ
jgi:SAM-dependent MidA family methyltransferase